VVVVEGAFVVVLVVFPPFGLDVFGAASMLTVNPAAATNAAGSAIHLVIAPPGKQSSKPCTLFHFGTDGFKLLIWKG
jgi:hypothetical protein